LILRCLVGNHTQRSAFSSWLRGPSHPPAPDPNAKVTAAANFYWSLVMKIERFVGYNEAREALVLSVAGVTAIMLTAYLFLLILY
jgi:hypothetical protein